MKDDESGHSVAEWGDLLSGDGPLASLADVARWLKLSRDIAVKPAIREVLQTLAEHPEIDVYVTQRLDHAFKVTSERVWTTAQNGAPNAKGRNGLLAKIEDVWLCSDLLRYEEDLYRKSIVMGGQVAILQSEAESRFGFRFRWADAESDAEDEESPLADDALSSDVPDESLSQRRVRAVTRLLALKADNRKGAAETVAAEFGITVRNLSKWKAKVEEDEARALRESAFERGVFNFGARSRS